MVKKHIGIIAVIALLALLFVGCSSGNSSLYATWSDNIGNTLMLNSAGKYTASLYSADAGDYVSSSGTFVLYMNTLAFSDEETNKTFADWDIVGNVLYINFEDENKDTKSFVMYKVGEAVEE